MVSFDNRSPSTERRYSTLEEFLESQRQEELQERGQQMDSMPSVEVMHPFVVSGDYFSPLPSIPSPLLRPPAQLASPTGGLGSDGLLENRIAPPGERSSFDARAREAAADIALRNRQLPVYGNVFHTSANNPNFTKLEHSPLPSPGTVYLSPLEQRRQSPAQSSEHHTEHDFLQATTLEQPQARLALYSDGTQVPSPPPRPTEPLPWALPFPQSWGTQDAGYLERKRRQISKEVEKEVENLNSKEPKEHTQQFVPPSSHCSYDFSHPIEPNLHEWKMQQLDDMTFTPTDVMTSTEQWNPTPIIDQFTTAFAIPQSALAPPPALDYTSFQRSGPSALRRSRVVAENPTSEQRGITLPSLAFDSLDDTDDWDNTLPPLINLESSDLAQYDPLNWDLESADLQKYDVADLRGNASRTQHGRLNASKQSPSTKGQADMSHADSTYFGNVTAGLPVIPPTDSGYASHKPKHNAHLDHKEQTEIVIEEPGSIKPTYAATSYTDNASLDTTRKETFVDKLADQLVADLGITSANSSNALELCDEIVDILAEFALKLGYGSSVNELERARVFIHKYRKDIGSCFRSIVLCRDHEDDYDDDETRSRSDEMPLSDKMQMYRDSMVADPATELVPAGDLDCAIDLDQDSAPTGDIEDFDKYLAYVCKTPHYEWLLATSRCKITLTSNNETMSYVRRSILSVLPQASHVRRLASRHLQTVFSVHWAPQELLKQRWRSFHHTSSPRNHPHDDNKEEADGSSPTSSFTLGDILTITGESSEAQALSCSAYLTQTWPTTGKFMLQLLEEVIIYGRKDERSVQRTDGTQITVSQEDGQLLKVTVSGTKDAIAEVGEQLAWLGAALRCSPSEEGAMYCTARICSTESPVAELNTDDQYPNAATGSREARPRLNDQHLKHRLESLRGARDLFSFNIDFELEDVPGPVSSSGACWKPLFQSPVIARGFPVMRRAEPSLGLEMPLNVMAGLLGTTYIHTFGDGVFLKGHSAILYPTQTVEDVVVWHLRFDGRGHYMHYPSRDEAKLAEIDADRLAGLRHVVGWCKVVENRTGIAEGNYKIERCNRLSWVKAGCVLEGCALSFGKSIVGGTPFTLLNDHDSLHITRKSYSTMLNYLSTRFVVFFDVRDRRGWLVNGVNALYHILRTSLEEDKARAMQNQSSLFVLKPNQLVEPQDAGAASAAWQFLDNKNNIFCKISLSNIVDNDFNGGGISSHKEMYETLGHRLEQFHDALEILFNYQIQAEELCGRQNRPRAIYEGWDFVDVTRRRDQRPRMLKLPLEGMACVDLLRSARAITLFGNGFGELIVPSSETFCHGWQTLPKMKYYIASSTADIQKLIKEEGESSREAGEPPQLSCVGRIMWFSPPASVDDCRCDTGDICLAKVVQVPWPRKHRSLVKDMKGPGTLESEGAVVFGYNSLVPWHWPEIGDPRPGPPPVLVAEDSDDDSGLGSSIDSMATDQSTVTTTVPKSLLDYRRGHLLFPPPEQGSKTYGNATVSGGRHNHFGDSFHQIINNYQQQTTDIAVLGTPGLKHERNCGITEPPERTPKRKRLE